MPTWVEWVGFVATVTNLWGNWMLAKLQKGGWALRLLTNVIWIVYAMHTSGGWPVMLNHVLFLGINVSGWWKWREASQSSLAAAIK